MDPEVLGSLRPVPAGLAQTVFDEPAFEIFHFFVEAFIIRNGGDSEARDAFTEAFYLDQLFRGGSRNHLSVSLSKQTS